MLDADAIVREAACLLAVAPFAIRGAIVRARSAERCEQWIMALSALAGGDLPCKRLPANIDDDRLVGGLDVAATLAVGRPVFERGLLAAADGGLLILSPTRARAAMIAQLGHALDTGEVRAERDGMSRSDATRFALIALYQPDDDERSRASLGDRLAIDIDLDQTTRDLWRAPLPVDDVALARIRFDGVSVAPDALVALVEGASSLGIASPRVMLGALAVARASAALRRRDAVTIEDLECAARLVYGRRAVREQVAAEPPAPSEDASPPPGAGGSVRSAEPASDRATPPDEQATIGELGEVVVRAARTSLPAQLIAVPASSRGNAGPVGRAGGSCESPAHGRRVGTRRGLPRGGARIDVLATLRAAAPMQRLRRSARFGGTRLIELRRDDVHVIRRVAPAMNTTLVLVDTSGSAALHRLADAKGAVEDLLIEGYARRDRVAIIAFRGTTAELVLPPTHALARARRVISALPAGGATPIANALDAAALLIARLRQEQGRVSAILFTDGRANVARDGRGGRARAEADALDAARAVRSAAVDVVFVDTAPRPERFARLLSDALGARYVALPRGHAPGVTAQ